MSSTRILVLSMALLALILLSAAPGAVAEEEKGADKNFVQKALDWVEIGDPIGPIENGITYIVRPFMQPV